MATDLQDFSRTLFAAADQLWTNSALRPDQYPLDFGFGEFGSNRMLDKERLCLCEDAVELHHHGFREDLCSLLVLGLQRLLEPRDTLLGHAPITRAVATSSALGTLRRTWKTPYSF